MGSRSLSKWPPHDNRNRKRVHTIIFRVTPMQKEELERRIYLCDRKKQDYMFQSAVTRQVIVNGNARLYRRIEERLDALKPFLEQIAEGEHPEEPVLEEIRMLFELTENWE